jgi:pimeloyl-ACP methyl ester carboxylesterase
MELGAGRVDVNGMAFHYLEAGRGPLVLCLHGFPDNAYTYSELLPALAQAGFRAVAPFMRGYAPTAPAPDGRYQSVLLAQDAVALITALGAERAFLVGHDWGATATCGAVALAPERVERMVTIGAAHPAAVRGNLAASYERHKGIWHAYFFQMPFAEQIAPRCAVANDFAFLEHWWRDASPEYDPAPIIERVKATFRQPGVVTAALSYYRHTFHPANRDPALQVLQERVSSAPTAVPTLALHGTRDRPGRLEAFEGMDDLFLKGLEKVVVPGTGHFVHVERPGEVARRIVEFFQSASNPARRAS